MTSHLRFLRGMVTPMGTNPRPNEKLSPELRSAVEAMVPLVTLAEEMGWPKQWLVCDHCGEYSWCFPPHIFDPCPMVVETVKAAGLKMDTERNQMISSGIMLREQMDQFKRWVDSATDTDPEDEE
jgi:hypothetical protein